MKILIPLLVCLALTFPVQAQSPSSPTPSLARVLPADCSFAILTPDVDGILTRWEQSGFSRMWKDPGMQDLWAPIKEDVDLRELEDHLMETFGLSLAELRRVFSGPMAVGMTLDIPKLNSTDGEEGVDVVLLADVTGHEEAALSAFEKSLQQRDENRSDADDENGVTYRQVREEFKGETLHLRESVTEEAVELDTAWSLVQGCLLISTSQDLAKQAMARLKTPDMPDSLAQLPAFAKCDRVMGLSDVMVFINVASFLPTLQGLSEQAAEEGAGSEIGLNMATLLPTLGLDAWEAMALTCTIEPEATHIKGVLSFSEKRGLLNLLAYGSKPYPRPDFIPGHAISVSASTFSLSRMWKEAETILSSLSPALLAMARAKYQEFLQTAGVDTSIDLKKNLLGNLGDEFVTFAIPEEPGVNASNMDELSVMAISLSDARGFQVGLDQLQLLLNAVNDNFPSLTLTFEEKSFKETTVHSVSMAAPDTPTIYYAVKAPYFLLSFGSYSAVTQALMAMGNAAESIWDRPDVKTAIAQLPEKCSSISFVRFDEVLALLFEQIDKEYARLMNSDDPSQTHEMPDLSRIKDFFGTMVVGYREDTDHILVTAKIQQPRR